MTGDPDRRITVPITTREFSRTAAAFGTALALIALPLTVSSPVAATPSPSPTAEATADSSATAESEATADSGATADSSSDGTADTGSDPIADNGNANAEGSDNADGDGFKGDDACKNPDEATGDKPCVAATVPLVATWDGNKKTLRLPTTNSDPTTNMPVSWVGETFSGPRQFRVPTQESPEQESAESGTSDAETDSSDTTSGSGSDSTGDSSGTESPADAGSDGETDDSGNPIDVRAPAVPTEFSLNSEGFVTLPDSRDAYTFSGFTSNPNWKFRVEDGTIVVRGTPYTDSGDSADSDSNGSASGGSGSDGGGSSTSADANAPSDSEGGSSGSGSGSGASADSGSRADGSGGSSSRANADASSEGASNPTGNGDDSGGSGQDGADADGAGADGAGTSADGESDEGRTTEAPSTGNGSGPGRNVIPGDTGDEWLPGATGEGPHPDYSDPVPRNPDAPSPDDDTDLITGGDQPAPRGNNQASGSFGESFVSTIVSSWPVLVLAAFGMGAVGFILFLVGRRSRRDETA